MHWTLLLPVAVIAAGAAHPPTDSKGCDKSQQPFLVPFSSLDSQLSTLAVMAVASEPPLGSAAEARMPILDSMLASALRKGGFQLVGGAVVDSIWRVAREAGGPIFDPYTGEEDTTRMNAARSRFRGAIRDDLGVDGLLYPALVEVQAEVVSMSQIEWDGVSRGYLSFGAATADVFLGLAYTGPTRALSLRVYIEDADGRGLYDQRGGLQVLTIPKHGAFVDQPESQLLADRKWLRESVRIALCPLLKRGAS